MSIVLRFGAAAAVLMISATCSGQPITFESLLTEMTDRASLARFPAPAYASRQFSSTDPASVTPTDPEGWFANNDAGHFIRAEERDGRREFVLADAPGPGAVVRIWSANPKGTLRVYLDGASRPVIEAPMADLLGGRATLSGVHVGPPLAAERSRGWNLYLPIPFAERCVITSDEDSFYYHVGVRHYDAGTGVRSLTPAAMATAELTLRRTQAGLVAPAADPGLVAAAPGAVLRAGGDPVTLKVTGPGAVVSVRVKLPTDAGPGVLRTTVIRGVFDGVETIWCPVGDFFGSGVGLNPFEDWNRTVSPDGTMTCRWIMPYREGAELSLINLGAGPVTADLEVSTGPWAWDGRSMHFHARWRQQNPVSTRPRADWNYAEVTGRGVLVGDSLAVTNPVEEWWGEGDEKIYVDGEAYPSHFGTGTEDYYGYAWCSNDPFAGPFHAQPRCDGRSQGGNRGHTSVSRVRLLDAVPFTRSLRFDMELWHWAECDVGLSAATFFYAAPGSRHNRPPQPAEARRGAIDPPPAPPPFSIPGAVECELMHIAARSDGLVAVPQDMRGFGRRTWSGESHLWVQGRRVGDSVELVIPASGLWPRRLTLYATRSWDYGVVQFSVNGRPAGDPVDLFSGQHGKAVSTGPIDLGTHAPGQGAFRVRAEVVGANDKAEGSRAFFGLDCIVIGGR